MAHYPGERVLLDDGDVAVVVSSADDGTVRFRTEWGIIVSSLGEDIELEPSAN
jgi:hypothetical protein